MQHTKQVLKSGLTVVSVPLPGVSSVTALVLANTGSRYEEDAVQGIAHFFEHIVFKGTRDFPGPQILAATIDSIGADFNAFTSKEYTGYYVKAASRHLDTALHVLSDMILHPLVKPDDIDRERGVIIEELNMYQDTPTRLVGDVFERVMYPNSGLSHDIIGTKQTIQNISQSDFHQFLNEWYGLTNITLVLAGDPQAVSAAARDGVLERYFGTAPEGRNHNSIDAKSLCEYQAPAAGVLKLHTKKTEQAHLILAWPGLHREAQQRHTLGVLSTLLGGTMSSRLFTEVREKRGLCYYVRSDVDSYNDVGSFGAAAGVDPNRIDEALAVIRDECLALISGARPITAEELERAQENIIGTTTLNLEDSRFVAQYYGLKHMLMGVTETPAEVFEKIKAVTLDDLNELADELLTNHKPTLAIVGPYEDTEKFKHYVA